jgi:O-antigen chain-terminating methyltransferase
VDRPSGSARPVVGPAVVFSKRVFRRFARWYAKPVADQQASINQGLLGVDERIAATVGRTEDGLRDLLLRVDTLEKAVDNLGADVAARPSGGGSASGSELDPSVQRILAYSSFEDRHRGSQGVVRPLLAPYLQHFDGCERVLDLGSGRGEFVDMLNERGITAYGVDSDASQVETARSAGRDVRLEDAVEHLRGLETGEVDGVFSSQVAEHLTTNQLIGSIDLVHRKLAPGGVFVMETPNPEALFILATFFYVDLTHIKPIHPEALKWAFEACGFEDVRIERSQRVPDSARLTPVPEDLRTQPGWDVLAANTEMLNDLIYGYQHYAIVAHKPDTRNS